MICNKLTLHVLHFFFFGVVLELKEPCQTISMKCKKYQLMEKLPNQWFRLPHIILLLLLLLLFFDNSDRKPATKPRLNNRQIRNKTLNILTKYRPTRDKSSKQGELKHQLY